MDAGTVDVMDAGKVDVVDGKRSVLLDAGIDVSMTLILSTNSVTHFFAYHCVFKVYGLHSFF